MGLMNTLTIPARVCPFGHKHLFLLFLPHTEYTNPSPREAVPVPSFGCCPLAQSPESPGIMASSLSVWV